MVKLRWVRGTIALAGAVMVGLHGGAARAAQTVCTPAWSTSEAANTSALQGAINTCAAAGTASLPGLVDLTPTGGMTSAQIVSVTLRSNLVLKVEAGFTLRGPDPADVGYTGTGDSTPPSMLSGSGLTNVTITGTGTIDGNGAGYWAIFNLGGDDTNQERPRIIKITGTKLQIGANFSNSGVGQAGVTFPSSTNDPTQTLKIKNAPKEQVTIESGSSNVLIDGVWIYAPTGRADLGTGNNKNVAPNTDGIDLVGVNPSGVGVALVQNCLIDTGDDDIAIKSNTSSAPTYNVTVRHCVFGGGHGLSIGGQETGGVAHVRVSNTAFSGTDFGFRIKTDNSKQDSGTTNDVSYANSCLSQVGEPILLTYLYDGSKSGGKPPVIENIRFSNIIAVAGSTPGQSATLGELTGLVDDPLATSIGIFDSSITGPGAAGFKVTHGTLTLADSTVRTSPGTGGRVTRTNDGGGATMTCPATIPIPSQK
jgi:polygalacturonase